jgi:Fe2+ or Zn2+ uptake regulation protein
MDRKKHRIGIATPIKYSTPILRAAYARLLIVDFILNNPGYRANYNALNADLQLSERGVSTAAMYRAMNKLKKAKRIALINNRWFCI